jgi:hypothetical protein
VAGGLANPRFVRKALTFPRAKFSVEEQLEQRCQRHMFKYSIRSHDLADTLTSAKVKM